jgi:hypothetical protein
VNRFNFAPQCINFIQVIDVVDRVHIRLEIAARVVSASASVVSIFLTFFFFFRLNERQDEKGGFRMTRRKFDVITAKCHTCAKEKGFEYCGDCEECFTHSATCSNSREQCVEGTRSLERAISEVTKILESLRIFGIDKKTLDVEDRHVVIVELLEEFKANLAAYYAAADKVGIDTR